MTLGTKLEIHQAPLLLYFFWIIILKREHTLFLLLLPPTPLQLWLGILVWNLRNLHENSFAKPDLGFTNKHGLGCVLWQVFSQKFPAAFTAIPNPLPVSLALYSLARYILHWTQRLELSKRSSPRFTFLYSRVREYPELDGTHRDHQVHKRWEFSLLQGLTLPSTFITDIIFAFALYSFFQKVWKQAMRTKGFIFGLIP